MRRILLLLLCFACNDEDQYVFPEVTAVAEPSAALVGGTITVNVTAEFIDDGRDFTAATITLRSLDPERLRASEGPNETLVWMLPEMFGTYNESFQFTCFQPGSARIYVESDIQRSTFVDEGTLIVQCSDVPQSTVSIADTIGDWIDSISSDLAERQEPHTDLTRVQAKVIDNSRVVEEEFPCSDPNVTCAGSLEGPVLHVAAVVNGPIPEQPDHFVEYALVAQADDDPTNDWVAQGMFDWDTFQQMDWWLRLVYDAGWQLFLTRVQADQSTSIAMPNAVVVRQGPRLEFFVPLADVGGLPLGFRVTAFAAGDASYPQDDRGGDVPGANPTELLRLE